MTTLHLFGFVFLSWVVFFAMLYCYGQYDNTLRRRWKAAGFLLSLAGVFGSTWFFSHL